MHTGGRKPVPESSYDPSVPTTGGPSTLEPDGTAAPGKPDSHRDKLIYHPTDLEDPTSSEMTGASGYEINNGVVSRYAQNNATSWDWGNLNPGTYMCFKVRAFNGVGDSWWAPNQSPWYVWPRHRAAASDRPERKPTRNKEINTAS